MLFQLSDWNAAYGKHRQYLNIVNRLIHVDVFKVKYLLHFSQEINIIWLKNHWQSQFAWWVYKTAKLGDLPLKFLDHSNANCWSLNINCNNSNNVLSSTRVKKVKNVSWETYRRQGKSMHPSPSWVLSTASVVSERRCMHRPVPQRWTGTRWRPGGTRKGRCEWMSIRHRRMRSRVGTVTRWFHTLLMLSFQRRLAVRTRRKDWRW